MFDFQEWAAWMWLLLLADAADAGAGRCPHVADADVGCRPRKFGSAFDVRLSRVGCMDVTAAAAAAVAGVGRCPQVEERREANKLRLLF